MTTLPNSPLLKRHFPATTAACALVALAMSAICAQATNYVWNGSVSNNWTDTGNWTPNGIPGGTTGTTGHSDTISIHGDYNITRNLSGYSLNMTLNDDGLTGTITGFSLTGGAKLTINSSFRVGSSKDLNKNALIGAGSELNVERFWLGNNTSNVSTGVTTATINGTVIATNDFVGYNPQNGATGSGGWILDIDGGSLFAMQKFNFRWSGAAGNNYTGHVLISNSGTLTMGEVSSTWTSSSAHYIDFVDGTGSVTFKKTGSWITLSGVEDLIASKRIRTGLDGGQFNIVSNGENWTVTVVPEPSAYAMLTGGALLAFVGIRRARANRRNA